ncbi:MAG: hypothetical protein J5U17_09635 [Candidatus Methanoperedens sp.]|nr:hypothetical protein [Candidatus Methanoperedens sp.]MCE8426021.1 hypothetical protein [Candidatus Methanoperedens sp.]MCE8428091.1 hypothetical protein [Candidatus Methanoperedens sp.]
MVDFLEKLQTVRSGYYSMMKLLFVLDTLAIFSVFYAISIIFQVEYFLNKSSLNFPIPPGIIPPIAAFFIGVIAAILLHRKDSKINVTLLIENKYPDLKEKLRTAFDNRDETNDIVESLKAHVSEIIDPVSPSRLLERKMILSKLFAALIFIAAAAIIATNPATYSIPPDTITKISNTITGNSENVTGPMELVGRPETLDNKVSSKGGGDIFGKPKIASIEGKNIDLTLYPGSGTGFTVSQPDQNQNLFRSSAAFPVDVLGSNVSDGGYSLLMKKTETEKQLINKYAVERSKI